MARRMNLPRSESTRIPMSDEEISTAVADELSWDSRVDASGIQVEVSDGIVTLSGSVPSQTDRTAASADAWGVAGVKQVSNLLAVKLPSEPPIPNDSVIRGNAENTLEWNPNIEAGDIGVSVDAGIVKLFGSVPTHWEKTEAETLVEALHGVTLVENELAVVPTREISDELIADDVIRALDRSAMVDVGAIDVTVRDGRVTLNGEVLNAAARMAAFRAASRTSGVISVENNLGVLP
ncbi:MAG: BON domain-containing protein [Wenzhouxiangellaceae bacterium]|nr:BON domain-containing protein [Wenzhouxiangellaceae bacterium]